MGDYAKYYREIDARRAHIRELEKERAGLEGFMAEVNRGKGEFAGQLARKRSLASKAAGIGNSNIAKGFGRGLLDLMGSSFQANVNGNFDRARQDAVRAIADVEHEIERERAQIRSIEQTVERLQAQERAEQERKAEEARRKAQEAQRQGT